MTRRFNRGPFTDVKILRTWQETLGDISEQDAHCEGYASPCEFFEAIQDIHKLSAEKFKRQLIELVWCVDFNLIEALRDEAA